MKAIILAAGKGKRMSSQVHKVLHPILGKPMLLYVLDACEKAGLTDLTVVVGRDGEAIRQTLPPSVRCVTQSEPKGTGHAVMAAREHIRPEDDVLVLYGDMPLVTPLFLQNIVAFQQAEAADAVVTAVRMPDPHGYGRVYMDESGGFEKVVEDKDLKPGVDAPTDLINTGVYLFKGDALLYGLDRLTDDNNQHEYYLPDVPGILRAAGKKAAVHHAAESHTVFAGINTQAQLAQVTGLMRERVNARHMENGVRMMDPSSTFIDDAAEIEGDVLLYPGVILEGCCRIARGAVIGPNTRMTDSTVGEESAVQYSVLNHAEVGRGVSIGPFAYLRPNAVIGDYCKIGDFVEVKNAKIGAHTNASHLAYIGDADIGSHVNYSCGAITVNYDGRKKHRTVVGDHAFVGCNSNLIAPVTLGDGVFVAAGSTVTDDVPAGALAIARQRQTNKTNWKRKG